MSDENVIREGGAAAAWGIGALGFLLLILSLAMGSIPTGWGLVAGFLLIIAAFWDIYSPSTGSIVGDGVAAVFTFLVPWFGGFAGTGAAWVVWIIAIVAGLCAVWSWASHPTS